MTYEEALKFSEENNVAIKRPMYKSFLIPICGEFMGAIGVGISDFEPSNDDLNATDWQVEIRELNLNLEKVKMLFKTYLKEDFEKIEPMMGILPSYEDNGKTVVTIKYKPLLESLKKQLKDYDKVSKCIHVLGKLGFRFISPNDVPF